MVTQDARTAHFDIAIVGGGMVGMSLAITLAREGLSVALIERGKLPAQLEAGFDGRVSAIAEGSRRILRAAAAWEFMAPEAEPILDIRVSDGEAPFFLHYDHKEVGEAPFGFIVENRHIRYGLQQAAKNLPGLAVMESTSIERFESDGGGVTVHVKGKPKLRCTLLIGADGKNSTIRSMAKISTVEWGYRQTAIVCTIAHSKPHHGLAQERFLPAGPFAVLPMTSLKPSPLEGEGEIHRSSLVWVEHNDRVQIYLKLPESEFAQEIVERVGDYLGDISVAGERFSYPLTLMHAKTYIGNRLALIGDAAHAIHPIAGQGVNLGFRDVGVLSELIIERFRLGLDISAADLLAHYQRWRRFDNVTMLTVTDGLNRLFTNRIPPLRLARGAGMWAVGQMPPLKRFFMRHAMGLVGNLPKTVKENS